MIQSTQNNSDLLHFMRIIIIIFVLSFNLGNFCNGDKFKNRSIGRRTAR